MKITTRPTIRRIVAIVRRRRVIGRASYRVVLSFGSFESFGTFSENDPNDPNDSNDPNDPNDMKRLVIAIDGPSGAGKGTISRTLSETLGYRHIDTGAMYRAVGWKALRAAVDLDDEAAV